MTAEVPRIGKYTATAILASGGTGVVWRVLAPGRHAPLALKILHASLKNDKTVRKLFANEYRIGMALSHPGLLRFFDKGVHEGLPFVVMELFRASSWATYFSGETRARALTEAPGMVAQAARALAYVHERGVVHRDIKPENFLVAEGKEAGQATVKLIDFASAQMGMARWWPFGRTAVGSPSYVAPEQLRRHPARPAADIYAFGATLYMLFAGRPPFTGATQNELLQQKMKGVFAPLGSLNAALSPEFARLVDQALALDPAARPESARAFVALAERGGVYAE